MSRNNEDQHEYFRFLDLHPKLRNNVYEKAFEDMVTIENGKALAPGILLACKQIHEEAIMTFYERTTFYFIRRAHGVDWYTQLPSKYRNVIADLRWDSDREARNPPPGVPVLQCAIVPAERNGPQLTPRGWVMKRVERFRADVEESGITVRQGVLKMTQMMTLEEMSKGDELFDKEPSEDASGEAYEYQKVWVAERTLESENQKGAECVGET